MDSSFNEKPYRIKNGLKLYYKIFIAIFIQFYIICIGLMTATLVYYNPWRFIGTFIQTVLSIGLPISNIFLCNFIYNYFYLNIKKKINFLKIQ